MGPSNSFVSALFHVKYISVDMQGIIKNVIYKTIFHFSGSGRNL